MTNIVSECRSANIVRDHAMILPDHATPKPDGIFGKDSEYLMLVRSQATNQGLADRSARTGDQNFHRASLFSSLCGDSRAFRRYCLRQRSACGPLRRITPCSRNWPPAPAIAREKLVGFLRPLATSRIERKPIRSCATPCIQERLDHSPTGLDPIRPLKQDRVPDHA